MRKLDLSSTTQPVATPAAPVQQRSQTPVDSDSPLTDNQPVQKQTTPDMQKTLKKIIPFLVVAVIAGVLTGFGANRLTATDTGVPSDGKMERVAGSDVSNGDVFGSADEKTFKDSATGYLEAGGLEGEGSHRLLRPGGEAQTVYLTSSVTDLDKLVGMEVQIWGETFKGQKAGWLMDVGRIKVIEVEGESPLVE